MKRCLTALLAVALVSASCRGGSSDPLASGPAKAGPDSNPTAEWFTERAAASGLDFVHFNGMSGELYYPEMFGPGVGLIDYDNDGDLDVYVVQGQMLGTGKTIERATYPPKGPLHDRLFRNDLTVTPDGQRTLRFTDVTSSSGIDVRSYGMGVAAGDVDNDGWVDVYRTGLHESVMLRNNGNGTFTDVTAKTRSANAGSWGVSAAFVDYDRDGWLDLYVGNYLDYSLERDVDCQSVSGQPDYCPPRTYTAKPDRLYHNRGDGTFEDVTKKALTGGADGPALGVSTADFDGDGWIDIYVGNDGQPNQLWMNQRDGTFKDVAVVSGSAVNGSGNAIASMGVDAGDFDGDGDDDLFVANWLSQMNVLFVNAGGVFEDRKGPSGIGAPSLAKTAFGAAWFDADNDGWLDVLTVNGSVSTIESQARAKDPFPFRMTNQLYRNTANGRFEDVTAHAGAAFAIPDVGRGAAFGDIDNDGDVDVVIGNDAGPLRLLINNTGNTNHWVGLRLVSNVRADGRGRDALGARVAIVKRDGTTLWRRARADGSYASANDPRVLAGLGVSGDAPRVRVQWPDGRSEEWADIPVDRWTTLRQGMGK